jgi:methionyl-tRNA formyltransferase
VFQPQSLKAEDAIDRVASTGADAMVVAAYGLILPSALLTCTRFGAFNIHASLLPRWRGAAPIQRALLAGDGESGISIMKMDEGLDTGPILAQRSVPIDPADDAGSLHDKLAELGARMMADVMSGLPEASLLARAQPSSGITYASKIEKAELSLDWSRPARELERAVRGFSPSPGATAVVASEPLKIRRARVVAGVGEPGALLRGEADSIVVACGQGALQLTEVQRPGGRRMSAEEFLRGRSLAARGPRE